jgi:GNAT superfamily N-acetyltransferase
MTTSFIIRDAIASDALELAALHVETFQETHGDGPTVSLRHGQWERILGKADPMDFTILAYDAGALVGFARGTLHDGGVPGFQGVLNKIYILRRCHRRGLGRLLVGTVAARFLSLGITSMLLFGEASNPSNGFYEHLGAERLLTPEGEFHGSYGWRDLSPLV